MTTATNPATETSVLQMLRAEVNVREFQRWAGMRRLQDTDHAMHCLLKETFGELAPKSFRLIVPRGGSRGCLYGYGLASAADLQDAAHTFADPQQLRALPASSIDSKAMPSEWQSGKKLGFEVRVRPIVRLLRDPARISSSVPLHFREGGRRPGAECDAFQWQAVQDPEKGTMELSREEVYSEWLSKQLERIGGASLYGEGAKLVFFQRTRSFRKLHARYVEGPDAVMRGILSVSDSALFANLLARGVGRHRAHGFGMLLLRPPGKPIGP